MKGACSPLRNISLAPITMTESRLAFTKVEQTHMKYFFFLTSKVLVEYF